MLVKSPSAVVLYINTHEISLSNQITLLELTIVKYLISTLLINVLSSSCKDHSCSKNFVILICCQNLKSVFWYTVHNVLALLLFYFMWKKLKLMSTTDQRILWFMLMGWIECLQKYFMLFLHQDSLLNAIGHICKRRLLFRLNHFLISVLYKVISSFLSHFWSDVQTMMEQLKIHK